MNLKEFISQPVPQNLLSDGITGDWLGYAIYSREIPDLLLIAWLIQHCVGGVVGENLINRTNGDSLINRDNLNCVNIVFRALLLCDGPAHLKINAKVQAVPICGLASVY